MIVGWAPPRAAAARYKSALRLLRRTWFVLDRERIPKLVAAALGVTLLGGIVIYLLEHGGEEPLITTIGEGLWYSIVTVATVGYGDYTPKSPWGRLVGSVLIVGGVTVYSFVSATIASILVTQRIREGRGLEEIKFTNHILVCGWNGYAQRVLEGLVHASGQDRLQVVLVNELSEEAAAEVQAKIEGLDLRWVRGDPAVETVLNRAHASEARSAIVLADTSHGTGVASDERTTLVILGLKSVKKELKVSAEALDLDSETHLKRAGADDLVVSGEFNGILLSTSALAPGVPEVIRQILALGGSQLHRVPFPEDVMGKTFAEAFPVLRSRGGFLMVAIVTEAKGLGLKDLLTDDYSLVDSFIREEFTMAGMEHLQFATGGRRITVNPPDSYVIGPSDTAVGIGLAGWQTSAA